MSTERRLGRRQWADGAGGLPRRRIKVEHLEPRTLLAGDILTGLTHHWTFDEISGDVAHDSAGTSDGTLVNWGSAEPKWEPGRVGGALRFDTPDNYVIAQPPAMNGSYAVSFWLNVEDRSGTNPRIFNARAENEIVVNNDSSRSVGYYYSGTRVATADPSAPTFNTWVHYAINFDASGGSPGQGVIYRNGVPVAVGGFVDSPSLASWVIGHSTDLANTTDSLSGALDDLRVYDRLLTDQDIAELASRGTPEPTHVEPIHRWKFDETIGNTAHDVAGGADGVLLNWGATESKWVPGKVDGALAFRSADNAVVTAPAAVRAQWSVTFWVNVLGRGGTNPRIIGPQDGRELWAYLDLENNGGGAFLSHEIRTFETSPIPFDAWEHYAFTYDTFADTATIFHDGVQVSSGPFHDNATLQAWVFGHNSDLGNNNDSLDGLLDDLRVYDRLLSSLEIQQLATVGPVQARNDAYNTRENELLTVLAAQGVLSNDTDLDDGSPQATISTGPSHGSLTLNSDGGFTYLPTSDYNGSDSFTYRLTDGQGNSATATVSLTVTAVNDAPSFIKGPDIVANDARGPQTFPGWATNISSGPANEAGQILTFHVIADHAEMFSAQPAVDTSGRLTFTPVTGVSGLARVTIYLQDNGGTADGGINVSPEQSFQIVLAPAKPGVRLAGGALHIVGTRGNDTLNVSPSHNRFLVSGTSGSSPIRRSFSATAITQLVADLGDGNDRITIGSQIRVPVIVLAGRGNDTAIAGGGSAIFVGGDGNDLLIGGGRRDLLIGGEGRDRLIGGGGSDLLIEGSTIYDNEQQSLVAIEREWDASRSLAQRRANLRTGGGPILQSRDIKLVQGETVFDDNAVDTLLGGTDLDWFFADVKKDRLPDRRGSEVIG